MTEDKADQIIRCVKECWWRVLLLIGIPLFFAVPLLWEWPEVVIVADGLAAWFQAIGAIAAIVMAFFVSRFSAKSARTLQMEKEQRERTRIESGYKEVVLSLVAETMSIVRAIREKSEEEFRSGWEGFIEQRVSVRLRAFNSVPLYDLGNRERIMMAVVIEGELIWLAGEVRNYMDGQNKEARFKALRHVVANSVAKNAEAARRGFLATF